MQNKHKVLKDEPARLEKNLFKACMFAKKIIENGESSGLANYKAGQYYGYSAEDVGWARNQLKQIRSQHTWNQNEPKEDMIEVKSIKIVKGQSQKGPFYSVHIETVHPKWSSTVVSRDLFKERDSAYAFISGFRAGIPKVLPETEDDTEGREKIDKMEYKGRNQHRLESNPLEKDFIEAWEKLNNGRTLELILHEEPTERDKEVAATIIQWLGSPVGIDFIDDVLGTGPL